MEQSTIATKLVRRLFQDEHYLFVAKPAGLRVLPPDRSSSGGIDALAELFQAATLLPVHHLDEHVSGLLPLAKSAEAAARLIKTLQAARASAEYLAVVEGGPRRRARSAGRQPGKAPPSALSVQVRRVRRGRSLIGFQHQAPRSSAVRAALRGAGLALLGEPRRRPNQPVRRRAGRIFLHRAQLRFRHPYTGRSVTVRAPAPRAFDTALSASDLLEDTLQVTLNARIPNLLEPDTDAFRLFGGKSDGVAGLVAEKIGSVIVLQTHQGKFQGDLDRVRRIAKWYARELGARAVYHKRFVKGRDRSVDDETELHSATPLTGKPTAEEVTIREGGLRFLVRPYQGYSTGLFLDQRANRRRVHRLARGKRVLNAFAYTCGFSVAAAAGGATRTVSVDISAKALEWGRRNFAANRIGLDDHLFIRSEVFDYLKRAQRQEQRFDLIVLDAPTFARSKRPATTFSVVADLRRLIAAAAAVLATGGTMLVGTNARTCSMRWLREQIASAADDVSRPFQITAAPALPPDFAADPSHAKSTYVRFA